MRHIEHLALSHAHLAEASVVARAHEHAADDVGAGHALRALDHLEAPQLLGVCVRVCAIWEQAGVIPVHHIVYPVLCEQLVQELWAQLVRRIWSSGSKTSGSPPFLTAKSLAAPPAPWGPFAG